MDMLELTTTDQADEERIPLFTIDGNEYTIPANPSPHFALQFADIARNEGEAIASSWLLEAVLGEEGYQALIGFKSLEPEQMRWIVEQIQNRVLGQQQGKGQTYSPPNPSRNGSKKSRGRSTTRRT